VQQAREHCLQLLETALLQNFEKHCSDCSLKFAVADEEAHQAAVNEEFAVFSNSKQAVGYKAAIMKCVNQVKQATAGGLLHSAFLPKQPETEAGVCSDEPKKVAAEQKIEVTAPASCKNDNTERASRSIDDCESHLSLSVSSSLVKFELTDPAFTEEKPTVKNPISSHSENSSCSANLDVKEKVDIKVEMMDVKEESDILNLNTSPLCPTSNLDVFDDNTLVKDCASTLTVSSITTTISTYSSPRDSALGLADMLTKPRKMVRISEHPPEVSYFRQSNSELAHKRKHADDGKVLNFFPASNSLYG
jgi:hypothetical protein